MPCTLLFLGNLLKLDIFLHPSPHPPLHTLSPHTPTPPPHPQQATLQSLKRAITEESSTLTRLQKATEEQRAEALRAAADLEQMQAQVDSASEALQARVAAVGCLEAALDRGCRQLDELQVGGGGG